MEKTVTLTPKKRPRAREVWEECPAIQDDMMRLGNEIIAAVAEGKNVVMAAQCHVRIRHATSVRACAFWIENCDHHLSKIRKVKQEEDSE